MAGVLGWSSSGSHTGCWLVRVPVLPGPRVKEEAETAFPEGPVREIQGGGGRGHFNQAGLHAHHRPGEK